MFIKKFVLHKFKRFFLSGVETFTYIPTTDLTIISWSNGMGKSSFISQLTPLPADLKKDFGEGGYKYMEFENNNDKYIVSSGYIAPTRHSFIKNGDELNPGGTATVQRQLVQEHLKLTPAIHQILLDNEVFTTMSPMARKHWFSQLSPIDYTYSITLFQTIKSTLRDLVGNIKITQDEIIKKSKLIINKEEFDQYVKDVKIIEKSIEQLSLNYSTSINSEFNKDIENIIKLMEKAIEEDLNLFKNYKDLNNTELEAKRLSLTENIKNINKELEEKDKLFKLLSQSSSDKEYLNIKEEYNKLLEEINKKKNDKFNYNELLDLKNNVLIIRENINGCLNILLDSEYRSLEYKDSYIAELRSKFEDDRNTFLKYKVELSRIEEQIKMLNEAKEKEDIVCPKCSHSWKMNFDHNVLKLSLDNKVKYEKLIEELTIKLKKDIEVIKRSETKKETITKLLNILSNPYLKIWSDNILTKLENTLEFDFLNNEINKIFIEIEEHEKLLPLLEKEKELKDKINKMEIAIETKKALNVDTVDVVEKTINELMDNRSKSLEEIKVITECINNRENIDKLKSDIKEYLKYKKSKFKHNVITKRNELITEAISKLKIHLNELMKIVNENESNKKVIESLQELINNNKKDINILSTLVKILSPESGLIAKSMNSFLNVFLDEMNLLINQVWQYPIEILPCEIEDNNDLNYKFKVKINRDEVVEDVSKLSSSQQEIVNLSFKVMFMKYMGLGEFPLLLDEFANTMDSEHRISAFNAIDDTLLNIFKQTILICHFESMYTRFVNAQFLELKDDKGE